MKKENKTAFLKNVPGAVALLWLTACSPVNGVVGAKCKEGMVEVDGVCACPTDMREDDGGICKCPDEKMTMVNGKCTCPSGETLCSVSVAGAGMESRCVDTATDPSHCGGCGKACTSLIFVCTSTGCREDKNNGVCESSQCKETFPADTNDPIRKTFWEDLLKNNALQVWGYEEYADPKVVSDINQIKDIRYTKVDAASLPTALSNANGSYLFLPRQSAPADVLSKLAQQWKPSFDTFLKAGGTVFVLTTGQDTSMQEFMKEAGLPLVTAQPAP